MTNKHKNGPTGSPAEESSNESTRARQLLAGAYAIQSVSDNIEYYRDFADIYDSEFADRMGYIYPVKLAEVFMQYRRSTDNPVADIGCGTGLVASAINASMQISATDSPLSTLNIDGIDLSQEMLDSARGKNLYRNLYQADLTQYLDHLPTDYGAVVSAGTFTFGHLGPEILPSLLKLGRTDTLYCIGVNSIHFKQQGFSQILTTMFDNQLITTPITEVRKIYDQPGSGHSDDTATVLVYRKL